MKFLALTALALLSVFAWSCGEPDQKQVRKPTVDSPKTFIPVTDYIRSEIKSVDSLPVGILKRVIAGNRSDSVFIQPAEFRQLASDFLSPELEKGNFEKSFTENSFYDQSIEMLTFTYQSTDPASTVKRVDVLIAPSLQLDKVKSIYIEKAFKSGDTAVNKKLYWKAGTSFQVVTEKSLAQKQASLQQVKVIWDPLNY